MDSMNVRELSWFYDSFFFLLSLKLINFKNECTTHVQWIKLLPENFKCGLSFNVDQKNYMQWNSLECNIHDHDPTFCFCFNWEIMLVWLVMTDESW
jgi:hypothetical protein